MMRRSSWILTLLALGAVPTLSAQADSAVRHPPSASRGPADGGWRTAPAFQRTAIHYGKWLTAASTAAFTYFAASENRKSRREWNALLDICRSSQTACAVGTDGRYLRSDAELHYQTSRVYDQRANRRLLGAQLSLLATAALFILDLRTKIDEPDNIPFSPLRVSVEPTSDGAAVGMRIAF